MSTPSLADLDRCEHGRHSLDPCYGCPDGWSTGNLFLVDGQRIGTDLGGQPIIVERARRDASLHETRTGTARDEWLRERTDEATDAT